MLSCPRCGSTYTKEQEFCGLDGARLVASDVDPMIGRTLDRYQIEQALGDGGMARVYRARHVFLEQDVAVKILFGDVASDKSLARRFQREAQAASAIKHKNVVGVLDFGATPEGLIFMAMELLAGRTLADAIRAAGKLRREQAIDYARQIASGLEAAHALGFVHRDLKPKNVMLVLEEGVEVAKILDFGLVLLSEAVHGDQTSLTQQGQVFGTPAFMAPEQVTGQEVDARADLYALGGILYHMLAGAPPFEGTAAEIAMAQVSKQPAPLPALGGLGALVMRLLAKRREERPSSAAEVVRALDQLAGRGSAAAGKAAAELRGPTGGLGPMDPELPMLSRSIEVTPPAHAGDTGELEEVALGHPLRNAAVGVAVLAGLAAAYLYLRPGEGRPAPSLPEPAQDPPGLLPHAAADAGPAPPALDAAVVAAVDAATPGPAPDAGRRRRSRRVSPPLVAADGGAWVLPEPPDGGVVELASPKLIQDRDLALRWTLSRAGLNWRDLAQAAPEAAEEWGLFRIGADRPTVQDVEEVFGELDQAARGIRVDRALLEAKLARVRAALDSVPGDLRGPSHELLERRYAAALRLVTGAASPVQARSAAPEVSLLENDAANLAHTAERISPRTSTTP